MHEPDAGDRVRIDVLRERKLHRDRMSAHGVQQQVREMISKILGREVSLTVTLSDPNAAASKASKASEESKPAAKAMPKPGPAVRKVMERFDGRVMKVNDRDVGKSDVRKTDNE